MTEPALYRYPSGRILVFAKAPKPGEVKTRLAGAIGSEPAAVLYEQLLRNTVSMAAQAALAPVELHVASGIAHPVFLSLSARYRLEVKLQHGADLGQRMFSALQDALENSEYALLIGTDCPVLDADYLEQACRALQTGADAVLGPVEDGGYVLIGVRRCDERLFSDIPWSTNQVSNLTRKRLQQLGLKTVELDTIWDLDTLDDLHRWQRINQLAITG
jgi:rSAM/selenodomain-associated transferase 1